jgi:hypothetical protein
LSIHRGDFSAEQAAAIDAEAQRLKIPFAAALKVLLDRSLSVKPAAGIVNESLTTSPGMPPATRVEDLDSKSSQEEQKEKAKTKTIQPAGPPGALVLFPDVETAKEVARKKREVELAWRIEQTWESYLFAREAFFRDASGIRPGSKPELRLVAPEIRRALLLHDRDRLAPEDRELWRRESPVLAAGVGIFYDPWMTGRSPKNDALNGGRRYLEAWRPWKLRNKVDPVLGFAELCFEVRDQVEATGR